MWYVIGRSHHTTRHGRGHDRFPQAIRSMIA
jgi:hypothetical protein